MLALRAEHRLEVLLEVAGLARSTFFYRQARLDRPDPHAELKTAIITAFEASRRRGHRIVRDELREAGRRVAKKTVLKLMRELGLACPIRQRRRYNSYHGDR